MLIAVYSVLLVAVLVLGAPYWIVRMATSGRYRAGLTQRLGGVPRSLRESVEGRAVVWVHAVSVGEVVAAARLIEELRQRLPGWMFAVSTTTDTGQRLAKQKMPGTPVFYLPIDLGFFVMRYLRALRPRLLVLMESELWPNLIVQCAAAETPIAVANARVSDRSFPRYMRLRRLWRPLLGKISLYLAQSEQSAERLRVMGAPMGRIAVTGNIKYDSRADANRPVIAKLRERLPQDARVLVCGSTLEGEERLLLEAWADVMRAVPEAVMVLAPRHPQRFNAVFELVSQRGFAVTRATASDGAMLLAGGSIFLLDTIGDLAAVYSLGAAAFLGGSLVQAGGHNPLEAAQFGVPVVMGAAYENFREIVERMVEANGIQICPREISSDKLGELLVTTLQGGAAMREMGERGRTVFAAEAGAAARSADALMELLRESGGLP